MQNEKFNQSGQLFRHYDINTINAQFPFGVYFLVPEKMLRQAEF
jgi:hypothetical protein